ncbi:hypothetical protein [Verrucosispora sp. TAA-831]|uniref:hypothetical protein n=1 Tax=Verrucosispora sp. TAA-831 TaxID=3422227 RepID=UPI003D6F6FAD
MTDHRDTLRPATTWLDEVNAQLGDPYLAAPEGIDLGDRTRRHWLWFPAGVNHNIAIDRYGPSQYEVIAGGRLGAVRWYGHTEPTDDQLRALCTLVGLLPGPTAAGERPETPDQAEG